MSEAAALTIDLPECRLCAQEHRGLPLHAYGVAGGRKPQEHRGLPLHAYGVAGGRKHPFATHWYLCPVSGEPMTIVFREATGAVDNEVVSFLNEAAQNGHWAIFVIYEKAGGDGRDIEYRRKTFDFDRNRYGRFMELASADLGEDFCGGVPKHELQSVKLPPGLRLFSKFRPQEDSNANGDNATTEATQPVPEVVP